MLKSLSGRFLILTTIFVMLAEILIFVPSVARYRESYLLGHLERAQIASLALLADDMIDQDLERELLENAGGFNVPGMMKVTVQRKPSTKARKGINPFTGEETMFKAKPARNVVKVRPLKALKELV